MRGNQGFPLRPPSFNKVFNLILQNNNNQDIILLCLSSAEGGLNCLLIILNVAK